MCSQPSGGSRLSSAIQRPAQLASPLIADAVTLHPVCQEELYNPEREVSINPNENSILTPQRPVPDVRLGYALTGQIRVHPRVCGGNRVFEGWRDVV